SYHRPRTPPPRSSPVKTQAPGRPCQVISHIYSVLISLFLLILLKALLLYHGFQRREEFWPQLFQSQREWRKRRRSPGLLRQFTRLKTVSLGECEGPYTASAAHGNNLTIIINIGGMLSGERLTARQSISLPVLRRR